MVNRNPPPDREALDLGRIQRQQSYLAKLAINNHHYMAATPSPTTSSPRLPPQVVPPNAPDCDTATARQKHIELAPPAADTLDTLNYTHAVHTTIHHALNELHSCPLNGKLFPTPYANSISSTAPGSPRIPPTRQNSNTPRVRPHATTLNIPGLTRSRVSPDGRIPNRDVGAKLVVIMVGLPARGKSYITNKLQRYLAWQQHHSKVFNVGKKRRVQVASPAGPASDHISTGPESTSPNTEPIRAQVASILVNGNEIPITGEPTDLDLNHSASQVPHANGVSPAQEVKAAAPGQPVIDQSAKFFDPQNEEASKLRQQFALDTLDELLDYLLLNGGSVGILDATNSTLHRRKALVARIQEREPKLGILFVESICTRPEVLEANMRLKLSGPDYKGKDPVKSLADFKERVRAYERAYTPIGAYEEEHDFQFIQLIDVGRKIITHRLRGFLSDGIASYLQSFNLSPRSIWITRHGQSFDNQDGKLGGDSDLTERGHWYGLTLYKFISQKNKEWLCEQQSKKAQSSFPPLPGDRTPPYPESHYKDLDQKNACVWTSMLKRSVETAEYFETDDDFDVKAWECLNEMHAGKFEGMTYNEIATNFPEESKRREQDKLHYVYPGVGGEGYLRVIGRLREMIREIERITDHVLIISHRSVCRVLMSYFMGLTTDDIADLDIPLGMLFSIEPKAYGIEFHAYRYNESEGWFDEVPDYKPQRTVDRNA